MTSAKPEHEITTERLFTERGGALLIANALEPTINAEGYDLVRVRAGGTKARKVQIIIEKPDGTLQVQDCEYMLKTLGLLPRELSGLQANDAIEISSPGLDRPLVRRRDFEAAAGRQVKVVLRMPIENRRKFTGVLKAIEESSILVEPVQNRQDRRAKASTSSKAGKTQNSDESNAPNEPNPPQTDEPEILTIPFNYVDSIETATTDDEFKLMLAGQWH